MVAHGACSLKTTWASSYSLVRSLTSETTLAFWIRS